MPLRHYPRAAPPVLGFLLLLAIPTAALYCSWERTQVDTIRTCDLVEIEVMPDGSVCMCYRDSITRNLFFARKSDTWRREVLGPAAAVSGVGRHLVVGPGGRPAVLLNNSPFEYLIDTDTGWTSTTLGWGGSRAFLAFDPSGHASVLWVTGCNLSLFSALDQDSAWILDTLWRDPPDQHPPPHRMNAVCNYVLDKGGLFNTMTRLNRAWSGDPYTHLRITSGWTRHWTTSEIAGYPSRGYALAPRELYGVAACYTVGWFDTWFHCDNDIVDSGFPSKVALRVDKRDQPQIVYRLDVLKYARRTDAWHIDTFVEGLDRASHFDLAVDGYCRPLIALVYSSGIFIARGDPADVVEGPREEPTDEASAALVSSPSRVPVRFRLSDPTGVLVLCDPLGRCVRSLPAEPVPVWDGRDDTGREMPAGLYFVRTVGAARSRPSFARFLLLK